MTDTIKPTPGPWVAKRNPASRPQEGVYADSRNGGIVVACWGNPEHQKADAALIAEAGTVFHETGLTPRQLLEQRDELRDALADMLAGWQYIRKHHGDLYGVGWERAEALATYALAKCGKVGV